MEKERTLILIKPDGMKRGLMGEVMIMFENAKLKLVAAKVVKVSKELAETHYAMHKGKPFYNGLIDFIQGKKHGENRILALVYEGENAVKRAREIVGATDPEKAEPWTIRGKYGRRTTDGEIENVVHASGTPEEGKQEVALWFKEEEIWKE
ncbi:MAG: nucleoside-diphosphate kinase [Candidatus Micrarchaeia archaeon]